MILVSHRGPWQFRCAEDGTWNLKRGAGGVAGTLGPLLGQARDEPLRWIAAAIGPDDRAAVIAGEAEVPGHDQELLLLDPAQHRLHYDVVSNATLWFLHHGLFDLTRAPVFDDQFRAAWDAYVAVNETFASAVAKTAGEGEVVLVQDYHLTLTPAFLAAARPDLRLAHFTHTPFCGPNSIRVLPERVSRAICESMASVPCGFHTQRWAHAFQASAREILGADATIAPTFVAPLGPDADDLARVAASDETATASRALDAIVGDRKLILRTDRIEPSKNIVRGFRAFDRMLAAYPEWRERAVFVAMLNGSRSGVPEYAAYQEEITQTVEEINDRWARPDWQPIVVDTRDDFARSVAGFARYDVLVVNPVKDGLNLVAKEGPLVNQRDGVVCLSPDAGAFDELHDAVLPMHPYDLEQGAQALRDALTMPAGIRRSRAARLRSLATAHTPATWLDQLRAHAR